MCVTSSADLADRMRILRDHGMSRERKYWHDTVGFNYRMTNLQAAIGLAQVERIEEILASRRAVEEVYREELQSVSIIDFQADTLPKRHKITWLVTALINNGSRDLIILKLKQNGIDVRPLFYSLGGMDIYKKYLFSNQVSRRISPMGISFPTGMAADRSVISRICRLLESDLGVRS